jgi:uncharacterized protein YoxC/surface antigen
MDTKRNTASLFFSFSLICIAASIVYFSYSAVRVVDALPQLLDDMEETITAVDSINELIPGVLTEAAEIRQTIPPLLEEIAAIRKEIPAILKEVASVRQAIPPITEEATAYRLLIPDVLSEVEATRLMVPPTLNRVDVLITQANAVGKDAGEAAVAGILTGVVKAPFSMVSNIGSKMLGREGHKSDQSFITTATLSVINAGVIGNSKSWINNKANTKGTVTLLGADGSEGRNCRKLAFYTEKKGNTVTDIKADACLNENGEWDLRDPES